MPYADLNTILNPATGVNATAAWGDQIRDNFENGEYAVARTVLGSAASSISSGTLPTLSNAWALKVFVRVQHATTTGQGVGLRFNGDSGSNYTRQFLTASDTTVSADAEAAATSWQLGTTGNESANRWTIGSAFIPDYLGSGHKTGTCFLYEPRNLTAPVQFHTAIVWASTAAITSVSLHASSGNFATGSSLTVVACNFV